MEPVEIPERIDGWEPVTYAKDQPGYRPLPALRAVSGADGRVLSRWRPTAEELAKLLAGDDLYLEVLTFHNTCQRCGNRMGLQPVILGVWSDKIACVDGSEK
jgi:hypothetical protein